MLLVLVTEEGIQISRQIRHDTPKSCIFVAASVKPPDSVAANRWLAPISQANVSDAQLVGLTATASPPHPGTSQQVKAHS